MSAPHAFAIASRRLITFTAVIFSLPLSKKSTQCEHDEASRGSENGTKYPHHLLANDHHQSSKAAQLHTQFVSPTNNSFYQKQEEDSCSSCLYTGIATCTGLALYFAKIALLETPDVTKEMSWEVAKGHHRNRAGFLVISAFCVVTGAYRWHLG